MAKWNEQGAPNNNLPPKTIKTSNLLGKTPEFSEELSDGGERNKFIENRKKP
ncbi:hypothetical protein [Neobacillus piezotolerans]|uniref:hypothetical protein n=1 Tax=Neobacillus piezotolerans TaxID=2259171 RepID=UPI0015F1B238|nr:hypothetical protein [Neobacillus piezotolerans]